MRPFWFLGKKQTGSAQFILMTHLVRYLETYSPWNTSMPKYSLFISYILVHVIGKNSILIVDYPISYAVRCKSVKVLVLITPITIDVNLSWSNYVFSPSNLIKYPGTSCSLSLS